jgi:ariadne-1
MKQYIHNLSAEYVSYNKSLRYCPGVDCEYCFQDLSLVSKNVACKCGTRFCFKCGREPHEPCTCEEIEKWFVLTRN